MSWECPPAVVGFAEASEKQMQAHSDEQLVASVLSLVLEMVVDSLIVRLAEKGTV